MVHLLGRKEDIIAANHHETSGEGLGSTMSMPMVKIFTRRSFFGHQAPKI